MGNRMKFTGDAPEGSSMSVRLVRLMVLSMFCFALIPMQQTNAAEHAFSKRLAEIQEFAKDLCETVPAVSSREKFEFTAEARARIRALLEIEAAGKVSGEEETTFGVLQEDLASLIQQSVGCRQDVFNRLSRYLEDSNGSDRKAKKWAPIFSPREIRLIPSCREKSVDCESPSGKDYSLLGYRQMTVFEGGSSFAVTYPEHLGRIVTSIGNGIVLHFEYSNLSDPGMQEFMQELEIDISRIADAKVCQCKL